MSEKEGLVEQSNFPVATVSEISLELKRTVESRFSHVKIRGEISGYRGAHASGHTYFALKDEKARIEAVIWRSTLTSLRILPEEGMEVIASGKLTTYPGSSKYQIVIEYLQPAGIGALMALLESRKKKLAAEGLFEDKRKKPLPFLPLKIGVITSPSGAVIRDILHRIKDRFPLHVVVWPARVQGESCALEVKRALIGFNALPEDGPLRRPDLIIIARGGGSLEDLWPFNDEDLARAVAASSLPVISAIGHETDWTLIDYVADRRAPTPTGAAEIAVPRRLELIGCCRSLQGRLGYLIGAALAFKRHNFSTLVHKLGSYAQFLEQSAQKLEELDKRLERVSDAFLQTKKYNFLLLQRQFSWRILQHYYEKNKSRFKNASHPLRSSISRVLEKKSTLLRPLAERSGLRFFIVQQTRYEERCRLLADRLQRSFLTDLHKIEARYHYVVRLLEGLSYHNVLARGFALILDEGALPITSLEEAHKRPPKTIRFADGDLSLPVSPAQPSKKESLS